MPPASKEVLASVVEAPKRRPALFLSEISGGGVKLKKTAVGSNKKRKQDTPGAAGPGGMLVSKRNRIQGGKSAPRGNDSLCVVDGDVEILCANCFHNGANILYSSVIGRRFHHTAYTTQ